MKKKNVLERDIISCFQNVVVSGVVLSSVTIFILALSNDVWVKHNLLFDAKFDMTEYLISSLIRLLVSTVCV